MISHYLHLGDWHELRRHDRPDRVEQLARRAAARVAHVAEQAALPLGG